MCSSSIRRDLLFHLFGNNYTVLSLTKWTDFRSAYGKYRQTYQLNYPLIHHMGLYYIEFASFMYQNPSQEEHRFPHHVPLNWNVSSPRFPYVLNPSKVHWKAHILVESREISLISTYLLVNFTIFHHTCWSLISQRSIGWLRAPRKTPGACLSSNVSRWLFGTRAILGMSALAVVAGKIDDSTITIPI